MQLHVRLGKSGIQAGCLEWCLRFDHHQCCKHHKRSHSALASTKKAHFGHFLITLSESQRCWFGYYPSGSGDLNDVKNLLSDRILTLYIAKLTICSGMHPLSALEEMASFLLYFILPLSLVPYMPYGWFIFLLHTFFTFLFLISVNQINHMSLLSIHKKIFVFHKIIIKILGYH